MTPDNSEALFDAASTPWQALDLPRPARDYYLTRDGRLYEDDGSLCQRLGRVRTVLVQAVTRGEFHVSDPYL